MTSLLKSLLVPFLVLMLLLLLNAYGTAISGLGELLR